MEFDHKARGVLLSFICHAESTLKKYNVSDHDMALLACGFYVDMQKVYGVIDRNLPDLISKMNKEFTEAYISILDFVKETRAAVDKERGN